MLQLRRIRNMAERHVATAVQRAVTASADPGDYIDDEFIDEFVEAATSIWAEATGVVRQEDVRLYGHALQCRVTTEDPQNNFIPDYGRITAYRTATGMGIRLDGGTAYPGAVVTRYYDSLLVKVTAWAQTPDQAIARMRVALSEMVVDGIKTNIPLQRDILMDAAFMAGGVNIHYLEKKLGINKH